MNHGKNLTTFGTSILILLSELGEVNSIDVFCPSEEKNQKEIIFINKVAIKVSYELDNPFSILSLLKINTKSYDKIIFNLLPTVFGRSALSNLVGLSMPIFLSIFFRYREIVLIYHNSPYFNDYKRLGYKGILDRFKAIILKIVERSLFKRFKTFFLLNLYKSIIDDAIGPNKVQVLNSRYIEAINTLYLNEILDKTTFSVKKEGKETIILLHGFWGPQKNLELALKTLKKIKEEGINIRLIISGGFNPHFPHYKEKFYSIMGEYSILEISYLGYISEKAIFDLFTKVDLIILPYNSPGGHSGVLEQATSFGARTIAFDFPEYIEQASHLENISLCSPSHLYETILDELTKISYINEFNFAKINSVAKENMKCLIE